MLTRKSTSAIGGTRLAKTLAGVTGGAIDRRTFLYRSGLAAGGVAAASSLSLGMVTKADAAIAGSAASGEIKRIKNICTHCSVGCTVTAEVQNGVWTRQAPTFESPFNLGAHCAKGAAIREHAHGERRLKYPMKLVNGRYERISWDQAINEVGDRLLKIREASGPDSVYWLGSAKFSNEQSYLLRKFAAFWGSNNVDHQARICHSTTVAGVAQTWGYGAMTNSYNDQHNSRAMFIIGGNPAEAHPVAVMHILKAKEDNNAALIVCDPRFSRTAAHATEHVRQRPGTDVPLIWGILWHAFENNWVDNEFIRQRVYGMDDVRKEVAKWTPAEVERVTGVPGSQVRRVAKTLWDNRPFTIIWCMGITQHHVGNNNTRALCILGLAYGVIGTSGGGANIYRGHDNVQGATDMGLDNTTLPAYYGIATGSWKHWARVWDVSYDYMVSRFKDQKLMETAGIPVSRWFDGVIEAKENVEQPDLIKAMIYWGHAPNSQTRGPDLKKAMEKLDTLVVIDPYPTATAVIPDRKDGVYLLPAATQLEIDGSRTASNRSLQWGYQIMKPLFESKPDHEIMYLLAKKLGFADELFKAIKVEGTVPSAEDILREINRGAWTIGYTGQSPERLKLHLANQHTFDKTTLKAAEGPCAGDTYGLPWPCWGTPEFKHPGTHVLYDTSKPVKEGGLNFRALFGVERNGVNMLAEGSYPKGAEIKDGHPQFSYGMLKKLGWDKDLTEKELATIQKVGGESADGVLWSQDISGGIIRVAIEHGCAPFGNAKARANVWNFPDPVPLHREPLYTPDREMAKKYPTWTDRKQFRLPLLYKSIQDKDFSKDFPIILTSGRLVEYEGGGDETRANPWLAELQQEMFIEINPADAGKIGVKHWQQVWVYGPENGAKIKVKALVTERVGKGVAWMPFHFAGHWMGRDLRSKYPQGADPVVLGESSNTVQTYGYDSVTAMQESKTTLCRIEKA
ncbi:MAG: formate dehydrogenase subunit alpha [Rhodospirillales bacterium]|nr:formate dehydrogenase subunit alpha [Rhodospirillales bacterium]